MSYFFSFVNFCPINSQILFFLLSIDYKQIQSTTIYTIALICDRNSYLVKSFILNVCESQPQPTYQIDPKLKVYRSGASCSPSVNSDANKLDYYCYFVNVGLVPLVVIIPFFSYMYQ